MGFFYDPDTGHILDSEIHTIPASATALTKARVMELARGQEAGARIVAGANGRPRLDWPSAAQRRIDRIEDVRTEAARRIHAVSPIWRQINDLRSDPLSPDACERWAAIDAIREASNLIERDVADSDAKALADFPIATHPLWPEI